MKIVDLRHLNLEYSSSSTGGMYLKSVIRNNRGVLQHYKLSNFNLGRFISNESVLEVIVSRLGIELGLPVLKYSGSLARILLNNREYTTFVSKSDDYRKAGFGATALQLEYKMNSINNESHLEYCRRIGLGDYIDKVMIFDYLIMNVDRHGNNIEILRDSLGHMYPSPIFDNGRCLTFEYGTNTMLMQNFDYKSDTMANNFVDGIYLGGNLKHIRKQYKLKKLDENVFKKVFYGLNDASIITQRHQEILKTILYYRYNELVKRGIIT